MLFVVMVYAIGVVCAEPMDPALVNAGSMSIALLEVVLWWAKK